MDVCVRRFFCDNVACQATTFGERMPELVEPYAHRTTRLAHQQQQVALESGGEAGARVLKRLGMPTSPDTLIRLIRKVPQPEAPTPRVLGVDDWSKSKGQSYGTLLVDLEEHQPVDVLSERSAASLETWLKSHPGVEIISRYRGPEYIKGATEGAPNAVQVADRWHLLKNLRDALEELLSQHPECLQAAAETSTTAEEIKSPSVPVVEESVSTCYDVDSVPNTGSPVPKEMSSSIPTELTKAEQVKQLRRAQRQKRYDLVISLHHQRCSQQEIARRVKLSRKTVRKYLRSVNCPMYPQGVKRCSKLAPHLPYMNQRWEDGCCSATQLWCELKTQGLDVSLSLVAKWAARKRKQTPCLLSTPKAGMGSPRAPRKAVPWTPRRASWLFVKPQEELEEEEVKALEQIHYTDSQMEEAYSLGQRFVRMIKQRQRKELMPWLEDVGHTGINSLLSFAEGIKQDLPAVTNALSLPWSNGQLEGQINRLKLIKRQMYGRANFDLLRIRVLYSMRC
jgi:transposase